MNWRHRTGLVTQWNRYLSRNGLKHILNIMLPELTWRCWLTNWSSCTEESCRQSSCHERTRSLSRIPWPESVWLKQVSGREQCLTFIAEKIFCQVLEQPGQPRGAEQAGQGVPDPAVLSVFRKYFYLLVLRVLGAQRLECFDSTACNRY